ncbi:20601_t:CDS:2 [Dentiscutata erythropus]|uniref:20601_t:CDS:1 n=1 Tax=Dentiscutata erythropus TaxID=1348616 RepID=A0A9N9I1N8_9GLOM|nr:20601_t:CDS:2 [Dentiscutata erythropus]
METSSIDNPGFDRKNKKARTSATKEEENLAEIWGTSYKDAENKELLQTVGQNSNNAVNITSSSSMQKNTAENKKETVEKTKVAEEENSWFIQTNNMFQDSAKQTTHMPNKVNNNKHVDKHQLQPA